MLLNFLNGLSCLFLDAPLTSSYLPFGILFIAGLWKILDKCGSVPKAALVPGYRYYELARCSAQEPQGRVWFGIHVLTTLVTVLAVYVPVYDKAILVVALLLPLVLSDMLFAIQIYLHLIEIFQVRKSWIILWLTIPAVPAMIWGFSKRYQPHWKLTDLEVEREIALSGSQSEVMKEGLTINLEERTVRDFFKEKTLLRDIHMNIKPGHMVLLLGGSGAGKSTLVNAINGYEKAKAEVILNGTNVYTEYDKMQYEIGFVPQQELIRGKDTVFNTLMDAATLRLPDDFPMDLRKKRVAEIMEMFGLGPIQKNLVEKLSGGQKKRLSIAMEFIPNPSLFILDEPDSGLDGVMARELMVRLRAIADQGRIVIVITHTPDRVIDLFDDVIVLAKDSTRTGRLAFYGPIADAREFFGAEEMEKIVMKVNRKEEGGEGRADEFVERFAEVWNG